MPRFLLLWLLLGLISACSESDDPRTSADAGLGQGRDDADAIAMPPDAAPDSEVSPPAPADGRTPGSSDAGSGPLRSVNRDATLGEERVFEGQGDPWLKAAPRATCASGDQPDRGTQGLSGDLRCNVEVAGKVAAPYFLSMAPSQEWTALPLERTTCRSPKGDASLSDVHEPAAAGRQPGHRRHHRDPGTPTGSERHRDQRADVARRLRHAVQVPEGQRGGPDPQRVGSLVQPV